MKKIFMIFNMLFILLLTSCFNNNPIIVPGGEIPTKQFEVDTIINDNMVFEEKSNLTIEGTAEANVSIKLELINKNNKIITVKEVLTDENNLKWSISFETPKGSFDKYQIKISDSYGKFSKKYENIKFGHVYMFVGDGYLATSITDNQDESYSEFLKGLKANDNIVFIANNLDGAKYLNSDEDYESLNELIARFGSEIYNANHLPTGVYISCFENTYLHEWLFKDTIDNHTLIESFLKSNNSYVDNPQSIGDMCYLGEHIIRRLKGISFSNIIWSQGQQEIDSFMDKNYVSNYFQMLYALFSSWRDFFGSLKISLLQYANDNSEYVINLRKVQETVADYYKFINIIPTFDLSDNFETNQFKLDYVKLSRRIKDVIKDYKLVSKFDNLVLELDAEKEVVTEIQIEFNNTDRIFVELNDDSNLINFFKVYYQDDNGDNVLLDIAPMIKDNFIIISLVYTEEVFDDENNITIIEHVYDKSRIRIEYGYECDLSKANLFNESGIPLLPFSIDID